MSINLKYDLSKNIGTAKRIDGKTNYYVGVSKICPSCYTAIVGYPAISRKDNKTEICSECGTLEAVENLINYQKEQ